MCQTSTLRTDFVALTKTVKALNKASRTMQDWRREQANHTGYVDLAPRSADGDARVPQPNHHHTVNVDPFQDLVDAIPNFDTSAFANFANMPMDGTGIPHDFVRSMEHDFLGRNWNEDWWDMGGEVHMSDR